MTNIFVAPVIGRVVGVFGERRALLFEYAGLVLVFSAYGGVYFFGWGVAIAATLYVIDHIFFALALAGMASVSFALALLIPRHPAKSHETVFQSRLEIAAE